MSWGKRDARLVACGGALIFGAVVLALMPGPQSLAALAAAFGVGLCATAQTIVRSPRVRVVVLVALLVAFLTYGTVNAIASGVSAMRVARLSVEALILAVGLTLVYEHAHGLARIAGL